ncbi:MAG: hypothetical protein M3094_02690 [Actinomycetia bacterium]|nr:hypothetical protein [Actinomycetes bacterium]
MNEEEVELVMELVIQDQARELIDGILIENGPSDRLMALKRLEMKLIHVKTGPS